MYYEQSEKRKKYKRNYFKRKWLSDPKFRENKRLYALNWRHTSPRYQEWLIENKQKNLERVKAWNKTPKGKIVARRAEAKKRTTEQYKTRMKLYRQTEKYKTWEKTYRANWYLERKQMMSS